MRKVKKTILLTFAILSTIVAIIVVAGVLFVKHASDALDTVVDADGKAIKIRIPGDQMQPVGWVTPKAFNLSQAVVSEALERTITPARVPCPRDSAASVNAAISKSECSLVVLDLCKGFVSFYGFVQRGPGDNQVVGSSIDSAVNAVYQRFGPNYVLLNCPADRPDFTTDAGVYSNIVSDPLTRLSSVQATWNNQHPSSQTNQSPLSR